MQANSLMVLLDEDAQWNDQAKVVAHWTSLNVLPHQESIPQKVEDHAQSIKNDYLAWVYDLSQYKFKNQNLISYLEIFKNLSFWWMTRIASKSPFVSPGIYQVFKLRALENLYMEKGCEGLIYCGDDRRMHLIFQDWCQKMSHPYQRRSDKRCKIKSEWSGINKVIFSLPFWFQALLFIIRNWFASYRHLRPNGLTKEIFVRATRYAA